MAANDVIALGLVAWMCGKVAHMAKANGKKVKFVLWIVSCALAALMCLSICSGMLFMPYRWMFVPMILAPLVVVPWGWAAKSHFPRKVKVTGFFLSFFACLIAIATLLGCMSWPLKPSSVVCSTQSKLEELLDIKGLPTLEYERAYERGNGAVVEFYLKHNIKSDSEWQSAKDQLEAVYDKLSEERPLQCFSPYKEDKYYTTLNDTTGDYCNFEWTGYGINVTYGNSDLAISENDTRSELFGFGNNPLPKHRCIAFIDLGGWFPDIHMRIQFDQPLDRAWLNRWKEMAKAAEDVCGDVAYREDDQTIEIVIYPWEGELTTLTIHKDPNNPNPIAEIAWHK